MSVKESGDTPLLPNQVLVVAERDEPENLVKRRGLEALMEKLGRPVVSYKFDFVDTGLHRTDEGEQVDLAATGQRLYTFEETTH